MGNPASVQVRMSCMIDYGGPDAESLRHLKRRPSSRESDTTLDPAGWEGRAGSVHSVGHVHVHAFMRMLIHARCMES
jgi:hypothetical protein